MAHEGGLAQGGGELLPVAVHDDQQRSPRGVLDHLSELRDELLPLELTLFPDADLLVAKPLAGIEHHGETQRGLDLDIVGAEAEPLLPLIAEATLEGPVS